MNGKTAMITGVTGQDGSYLAELLIEKGYNVFGIVRRTSLLFSYTRLDHIRDKIHLEYGDMSDGSSLTSYITKITRENEGFEVFEIYNLAAQSHVRISFDIPQFTAQTNALGVLNLLEAYRLNSPNAKFYQASSSEMFGNSVDEDGFQRETTPFTPVSPYGCAKVFGFNITRAFSF